MNVHKAKETLAEARSNGQPNALFKGLKILSRHCKDPDYLAMQNFVFVKGFDLMVPNMTEEEVMEMSFLGWFYDSQYGGTWRFQIKLRPF